jgi:UPF0271 protein
MPHITSANVACGFHAGDPMTIKETINLAKKLGVAVGAHPSLPDLMGFGRREMQLTAEEARCYTIYQVSTVQAFAKAAGIGLQHIKPHGALYNMATKDKKLSEAIADAARALDRHLIILARHGSILGKIAVESGLRVAYEFFADRAYNPDGSLVSRKQLNSIIQEPRRIVERALKAITEGEVSAVNGEVLNIGDVHTICVHGDTPNAARLAERLNAGLVKAGVKVEPVSRFI